MVTIAIFDGLGNQMFQYAFYKFLRLQGYNVKADIMSIWNKNKTAHNGYELNNIFKLNIDLLTAKERDYLINNLGNSIGSKNVLLRIYYKLKRNKSERFYFWKNDREAITYNENYLTMNNKYLYAHYQSEKYFKIVEKEIRKDFIFVNKLDKKNLILKHNIENENAVSIHVRRGDYLNKNSTLSNVCTIKYYLNAINYILKRVDNPKFYIFSNDITWCKENLYLKNAVYINHNKGKDSYKDMQLMSSCKHNIIANSTFSWWGAWLNNNKNKIVIAPNRWFNNVEGTYDIIPESWKKIEIL